MNTITQMNWPMDRSERRKKKKAQDAHPAQAYELTISNTACFVDKPASLRNQNMQIKFNP